MINSGRRFEKDIELVFLLRLLYGYFVLGYQNYEASIRFFESQNVDGFQIGTTYYSRNANITKEWQYLSIIIKRLIKTNQIEKYMLPSQSTDEIIRELLASFEETDDHYA